MIVAGVRAPASARPPGPPSGQWLGTAPPGPQGSQGPQWSQGGPPGPWLGSAPPEFTAGTPPTRTPRLPRSVPIHLDIPAIGVHTSLLALGLAADGTVALPPLRSDAPAGWYSNLATPGEIGTAVILGHVDTAASGPAVFFKLGAMRPGEEIIVARADGSKATFTVETVADYPKSAFPTAAVYGAATYPALRLVTCGGTFDRARRTYRSNVVVYARLTAVSPGHRPVLTAARSVRPWA